MNDPLIALRSLSDVLHYPVEVLVDPRVNADRVGGLALGRAEGGDARDDPPARPAVQQHERPAGVALARLGAADRHAEVALGHLHRAQPERGQQPLEALEVPDGGRQRQRVLEHGPGVHLPYPPAALLVVNVMELSLGEAQVGDLEMIST